MLSIYSNREKFSLLFLIHANYTLFGYYAGFIYHKNLIYTTILYSIIDNIWIYFDHLVRVSKNELYIHHICSILLASSNITLKQKYDLLLLEFSTLALMLSRIKGKYRFIVKKVFLISWCFLRVFWLGYVILAIKYYDTNHEIHKSTYISLGIIYVLSIKRTLQSFKKNIC